MQHINVQVGTEKVNVIKFGMRTRVQMEKFGILKLGASCPLKSPGLWGTSQGMSLDGISVLLKIVVFLVSSFWMNTTHQTITGQKLQPLAVAVNMSCPGGTMKVLKEVFC
jgi:hypothetical protein